MAELICCDDVYIDLDVNMQSRSHQPKAGTKGQDPPMLAAGRRGGYRPPIARDRTLCRQVDRMKVLFDAKVGVAYSQVYVTSDDDWESDLDASFVGQANGLCGASQPGYLWLVVGTQNGDVRMRVELNEGEPQIDDAWEDIVEVSFVPNSEEVNLTEWAGEATYKLALPHAATYRVRYCCLLMDAQDESDRYVLSFWPAPVRPDAVVKQSSAWAAYWHKEVAARPDR